MAEERRKNEEAELIRSRQTDAVAFGEKVRKANIPGYDEAIQDLNTVTQLPWEIIAIIQKDPNGPQLAHHLGTHLDTALEIANLPLHEAGVSLGRLSGTFDKKTKAPSVDFSKAPDPIKPVKRGGAPVGAAKEIGDMSMDEIMALED
jgi:hypothetical protein